MPVEHAYRCLDGCLDQEPPFCRAVCPFGLDVRDFIEKVKRGGFQAGYKAYLNAVGFPQIVAQLCSEPCKGVCPRGSCGGAIEMRMLEQAAIDHARTLDPVSYNVPRKGKAVAVIGAGLSGLACALRLASKGYDLTVFEASGRLGGRLHELLQPDRFLPEIARQFMHENVDFRLNTEIATLDGLAFDAIYLATGAGGSHFNLAADPQGAFATTRPGVFFGGMLAGRDLMGALADGLKVGHAIERWLKAGGMNHPADPSGTELAMDVSRTPVVSMVLPGDGQAYSREEAAAEASRCLDCKCDACYRACDLMHTFRKFPRRIGEEVHLSVHPGTLDGNGTLATRLMSTCNQCGLCKEVCPKDIDTGGIFLHGHRAMREKGAMPWAWHDAFLRDMDSANGEASLSRRPEGFSTSRYLFFPGCQLGASDARYVIESYGFLREHWPDTAIQLGCCGAPAEWAGDEPLRDETHAALRRDWEALGHPAVVLACPSCKQMFGRHLPDMKTVFLYDLLLEKATLPEDRARGIASVFDPCASREEPAVQQAVRALAERSGFTLEALPMEGRFAQCCSWGGQVSVAHPPYAQHVVAERISAGPHPYLTYCINCRDTFARAGKPSQHILDVVFGLNDPERQPPTFTDRRSQRLCLKQRLLQTFWNEAGTLEEPRMELRIAPELRRKLDGALILETDLAQVIDTCEQTGQKVFDPAKGSFTGHLLIGCVTYWAEYRPLPGGSFELLNAYAHRMRIEEG